MVSTQLTCKSLLRSFRYEALSAHRRRFPTRQEAQACNTERLDALPGEGFTYNGMDSSGVDVYGEPISRQQAKRLLDDEIVLSKITLKVTDSAVRISKRPDL